MLVLHGPDFCILKAQTMGQETAANLLASVFQASSDL